MATWWELAIPAAAVVAGSSVTALAQGMTFRGQQKHEKKRQFIDERRATYARYLMLFEQLLQIVRSQQEAAKTLARLKESESVVTARIAELRQAISSHPDQAALDKASRELDELDTEGKQIGAELDSTQLTLDANGQKLDLMASELLEIYYTLRLLAPSEVQAAAAGLISEDAVKMANDKDFISKRRTAFEEAARRDLT